MKLYSRRNAANKIHMI